MTRILLIFLLITITTYSYGCKIIWQYNKSSTACVQFKGEIRHFRYFIPNHAKGVILPLVIALHGGGGNPKRFEHYSHFSQLAQQSASFIMLYPQANNNYWQIHANQNNDRLFISHLITLLPHIDPNEIYLTGMSNGGLMIQTLACQIAQKIKGIAIVAATMSESLLIQCPQNTPLNTLIIFGDQDTAFLNNGLVVNPLNTNKIRMTHIGINNTLNYWRIRNQCQGEKTTTTLNQYHKRRGKFKDDHTTVIIHNYTQCQQKLRFYDIKGGGHRWPDTRASNHFMLKKTLNLGYASHEINAVAEIINFFQLIKR
jgi:polyhydroxybutyrate depolymerase